MKLFELMRQIQDACLNDGNLEKEVIVVLDNAPISTEKYKVIGVDGELNQIQIQVSDDWILYHFQPMHLDHNHLPNHLN